MTTYQPYTYIIGWTSINKFYYGVRYAKNCNPSDLWMSYFTSSRYVKNLRETIGEPDVIKVRRTFSEAKQAIEWEHKALRRLKVLKKPQWINKNINGKAFCPEKPKGHQVGSRNSMFGKKHKPFSNQTRAKMSDAKKGKKRPDQSEFMRNNNPMAGTSIPFWTDGSQNVRRQESPGKGWRRGFVRKPKTRHYDTPTQTSSSNLDHQHCTDT